MLDMIDSLYKRYQTDKNYAKFLKDAGISEGILNLFKKATIREKISKNFQDNNREEGKIDKSTESDEKTISNSDGFSKLLFEDLKIKRVLSEDNVAQEYILSQNDIHECFSYLSKNYNNIKLYQGKTWVIEYSGGL